MVQLILENHSGKSIDEVITKTNKSLGTSGKLNTDAMITDHYKSKNIVHFILGEDENDTPYSLIKGSIDEYVYSDPNKEEKTNSVNIYFSSLTPEAQKKVLEAAGISDPKEANWDMDILPLTTLDFSFSDGNE